MSFVLASPGACATPPIPVEIVASEAGEHSRSMFASDLVRETLWQIDIAGVRYPLRHRCLASYIPAEGCFLLQGFSPRFVGRGSHRDEARENCFLAIHAAVQTLLHKRPFEMPPEEQRDWSLLSERIDVTVLRNNTPVQVRQFGRVNKVRPYPVEILWEDGRREPIDVRRVNAPDFITYRAGQPFEAIVERDPVDFRLRRIIHIERRSQPSRLAADQEADLLRSIGSAKTLPETGWD
ncbi:MAG: hypothetical protein ACF8PG_06095 [Maioricimonas sp. JB045]|uniref:hypothetical protein n=1 Tax=Maioricimonas sp. JC845 TaxID=3232138 RepID=UPI00345A7519